MILAPFWLLGFVSSRSHHVLMTLIDSHHLASSRLVSPFFFSVTTVMPPPRRRRQGSQRSPLLHLLEHLRISLPDQPTLTDHIPTYLSIYLPTYPPTYVHTCRPHTPAIPNPKQRTNDPVYEYVSTCTASTYVVGRKCISNAYVYACSVQRGARNHHHHHRHHSARVLTK